MTRALPTTPERADERSAKDFGLTVLSRWRTVVATFLVVVLGTALWTTQLTPRYTSTSTISLAVSPAKDAKDPRRAPAAADALARSCTTLATRSAVLQRALDQVGAAIPVDEFNDSVVAQARTSTVVIDIEVSDTEQARAARLATAVAAQLTVACNELRTTAVQVSDQAEFGVVADGQVPKQRSFPRWSLNLAVAMVVGLLLGVSLALGRDSARPIVRDVVRRRAPYPLLGTLRRRSRSRDRAALQAALVAEFGLRGTRGILIASAVDGSAAVRTAAEIAAMVRDRGQDVLVVDAGCAARIRMPDGVEVRSAADPATVAGVVAGTSGVVLVLPPPVLASPVAGRLAPGMDVVLVAERGRRKAHLLTEELHTLTQARADVGGIVVAG